MKQVKGKGAEEEGCRKMGRSPGMNVIASGVLVPPLLFLLHHENEKQYPLVNICKSYKDSKLKGTT